MLTGVRHFHFDSNVWASFTSPPSKVSIQSSVCDLVSGVGVTNGQFVPARERIIE